MAAINRAIGSSLMHGLLKSLRAIKSSVKFTAEELAKTLKNSAKTGISTLDNILSKIKVNKTAHGFLTVGNDVPIGKLERALKAADLDGLAKLADSTSTITSKEKSAFKDIIGDTAEAQLHNLDELTNAASKSSKYSDLNIKSIGKDTSPETVAKINKAQTSMMRYFKPGAVIVLTVGVAYIVVDGLINAVAERSGCFMVTTISGKTQSCKVSSLTCSSDASKNKNPCDRPANKYPLNVMLCLLSLEKTNAATVMIKAKVCEISGVSDAEYMSKFNNIINHKDFNKIFEYIQENVDIITENNTKSVCSFTTIYDPDGKLPLCRMCDPSASPLSTTFVDGSELAENITFECREATILDTIIDIGKSTGKDLLGGIGNTIWGFVKPFAIAIGVFAVIAFVVGLIIKLISKAKQSQDTDITYKSLSSNPNVYGYGSINDIATYSRFT